MKKLLVLLLALCMVFALAACDPQPEEQPIDPNKDEIAVDPMEILESGEYYIEFTLHTMGIEADGIITALDDRYFSSIDLFGIISKTLTIGEDMYFLNDLDKTYTISKIADAALDAANHFLPESFDGLLEIDSGSSIIEDIAETDSTVYEYVEYSLPEDIARATEFLIENILEVDRCI